MSVRTRASVRSVPWDNNDSGAALGAKREGFWKEVRTKPKTPVALNPRARASERALRLTLGSSRPPSVHPWMLIMSAMTLRSAMFLAALLAPTCVEYGSS
jgi:hypothetical protein